MLGGVAVDLILDIGARRRLGAALTALERGATSPNPAVHSGSTSHVIGVTGAPGVGKSSLVAALIRSWRATRRSVAVLAIDPTSPISGGALLGDRLRMGAHESDAGVFIRSVATRGHLGGGSRTTPLAVAVLEAAGFDLVVVETVGVGQSECEIAAIADTVLWCTAPGLGDEVQAAKSGILDLADVVVVNKSDRSGAGDAFRFLESGVARAGAGRSIAEWEPVVLAACALDGDGVSSIVDALERHREAAIAAGITARRRDGRVRQVLRQTAVSLFASAVDQLESPGGTTRLDELTAEVLSGERALDDAAGELLRGALKRAGG